MDNTISNLIIILCLPKFVFWFAVFAYEGFVNNSTLTLGGLSKSGITAKVYGAFYSLGALLSIAFFALYFRYLLQLETSTIKQSLLHVEPIGVGFVSVGITVLGIIFKLVIRRYSKRSIRTNKYRHKIYNSMLFFFGATGIQNLISAPQWVLLCVFAFFVYFGSYMSPKTVILAMKPNVGKNFVYFKKIENNSPLLINRVNH